MDKPPQSHFQHSMLHCCPLKMHSTRFRHWEIQLISPFTLLSLELNNQNPLMYNIYIKTINLAYFNQISMKSENEQYEIDEEELLRKCDQYDWKDEDNHQLPTGVLEFQPRQQRLVYYRRLRHCLQNQEESQRAFHLSSVILYFNQNNYYALMIRKNSHKQLKQLNYLQQFYFINCLLNMNTKQYQLWNYKKQCLTHAPHDQKLIIQQYRFMEYLLTSNDSKIYHVWDFRNWLTRHYSLFDQELTVTSQLLFTKEWSKIKQSLPKQVKAESIWLSCNALWSYRFNLFVDNLKASKQTKDNLSSEYKKLRELLGEYPLNQSGWNYAIGLHQYLQENCMENELKDLYEFAICSSNRFSLNYILMRGKTEDRRLAFSKLKDIDPTRALYYLYIEQNDLIV